MPLLCFDLVQGRSENQIKRILDVTHEVMVNAFNVPERDRYQIVKEHAPSRMIIEDTGLGIKRTPNMMVLQVTTRPRSRAMKQVFYRSLVERLADVCGISPSDVVVTFITNADEDWSFGLGRAQFLTGELEQSPTVAE
jgi:phenylpyruvate tautomerase PptA (4-oxalocrotonate tautomerase family)